MQPEQADFAPEGYFRYFSSAEKKGYSGTAVYTKREPMNVTFGLDGEHLDEGRVITCEYDEFYFVCCYVPNAQPELKRILRYRFFFDCLAALVFFLKGNRENASAVFRARRDYKKMHYAFASERSKNLISSTDEEIPERVSFSILRNYYLMGRKRFRQLKLNS